MTNPARNTPIDIVLGDRSASGKSFRYESDAIRIYVTR
jgi:hypothetical protein